MNLLKQKREWLKKENRNQSETMTEIPSWDWPANYRGMFAPLKVFRSTRFLAQMVQEPSGIRLSINRAEINSDGGWKDGITWDEMQQVKNECGFADKWAVECFPAQNDVINVANIRHLWILDEVPAFGWPRKP